jgi:hypothetical protein
MQKSITKEAIEELPLEQFHGKIHIIETQEQLKASTDMIRHEKLLGIDTETKPSFKKRDFTQGSLVAIIEFIDSLAHTPQQCCFIG